MSDAIAPKTVDQQAGKNSNTSSEFDQSIANLEESYETAQVRNVRLREVGIEEGTILSADKKQASPV